MHRTRCSSVVIECCQTRAFALFCSTIVVYQLILVGKGFYDMYKTKKVDVDKLKDIASIISR